MSRLMLTDHTGARVVVDFDKLGQALQEWLNVNRDRIENAPDKVSMFMVSTPSEQDEADQAAHMEKLKNETN